MGGTDGCVYGPSPLRRKGERDGTGEGRKEEGLHGQ